MSKFDWMELETLNGEIAHAQKRLAAARAAQDHALVRLLEQEIAETAERRARVLNDLAKGVEVVPSGEQTPMPVEQLTHQTAEEDAPPAVQGEAIAANEPPSPPPASDTNAPTGEPSMWDKLSTADIERVKRALTTRRSEMLARHAEELKALEAEQAEIDTVERAIAIFTQKFKVSTGAEVVPLDGQRVPLPTG